MHSAPSVPFGVDLEVPPDLDLELDWFIDKHVHEVATTSLWIDRDPKRLWEKSALTAIGGWLQAMDAYDADILRCAYAPAGSGRRSLGRLTPVFARFASAEPGWPDAIHWQSAMRHMRTAADVFRAAIRAYASVRGHGPCLLHRVT
jgi:hypothetical protein